MKILVFGNGYLGNRIRDELDCYITSQRVNCLDDIQNQIDITKPDIIINCIGYTGKNNVDDCEFDRDKTLFSNSFIPVIFAEACSRNKIKLITISSGCIYDFDYGKPVPIPETREPDFFNLFYSRTKIYAEKALELLCKKQNILILRIRIPLDDRPHPKNILTKLIKYQKVIDLPNSVTYIPDFIIALVYLIEIDARGLFNVVNSGGLRYPDLMKEYQKFYKNFQYSVINYKELGLIRTNLLMSTDKLEKAGFPVRNINDIISECVSDYVEHDKQNERL